MQTLALTALFGFALWLTTGPANAADSVPLDDATHVESRSLDSADDGEAESLDSVPAARAESLDSVDDGEMVPLSDANHDTSHALDSAPQGTMHSLDSAEAPDEWAPPSCNDVPVNLPRALPAGDSGGWERRLSAARNALDATQGRLDAANGAYSRAITRDWPRGQGLAKIIHSRDQARAAYGEARCHLPALIESAERAGVEPGVIRAYR